MTLRALTRLDELLTREPWVHRAACLGRDTELFYPLKSHRDRIADVKAVCDGCPVRADCLNYALANNEPDGIWGGMSPDERRTLLRRRAVR